MKLNSYNKITLLIVSMMLISCNKTVDSFSLLSEQQIFKQEANFVARKLDILWVIDNSGSMQTSQTNLSQNFQAFINAFPKGTDFRMAVTTTAAYQMYYTNNLNLSRFKDGNGNNHSGVFVMDKNTPNLESVFVTNVNVGINGTGDERAFSSFKATLENTQNSDFRRPDAFLAIVIVSDEDDFSHTDWQNGWNSYFFTENYNYSGMHPISTYTNYLNALTNSTPTEMNYSVNTISILDTACRDFLNNSFTGRKVSQRYIQLADATQGIKSSLCGDFATALQDISKNTLELASKFKLTREPVISTISVVIDGVVIPEDAINGWTYDASSWTVSLHGSSIPGSESIIKINYDPVTIKE